MSHRQHGTYVKYKIDDCRCPECTRANRDYVRGLKARLEPPYVTAGTARKHCRDLMSAGVGLKQIVKKSGVSQGSLWKLLYGKNGSPSKRIRRSTEQRILAVTPADVADGAKIDAAPTWALIDEMVAAGVPKSYIAVHLGSKGPGLQLSHREVTAGNARRVRDLHTGWTTGRIKITRRDRWGNTTPIPPPPAAPRKPAADVSDLYLELAEILEERTEQAEWRKSAACRGRPSYLWFPARGDAETLESATDICSACMVRDQCRSTMFDQPVGVYGGLSAGARRRIRHRDNAA